MNDFSDVKGLFLRLSLTQEQIRNLKEPVAPRSDIAAILPRLITLQSSCYSMQNASLGCKAILQPAAERLSLQIRCNREANELQYRCAAILSAVAALKSAADFVREASQPG